MDRGGAYADILLDRTMRRERIPDPRDRALLTELVMGTLRRRGTIDFALAPHLARPLDRADLPTRSGLRLGAYQLLYLRLPERAAVYETVAAVKRAAGERPAGFVNAVLRGLQRAGGPPSWPERDAVARMAARLSAPPDLVRSLVRSLGEEEAAAFLAASLEKPPFTVRANRFRVTAEALLARFEAAGADPAPCRYAPAGIVLRSPVAVHADPAFREGACLAMDEGAQLIGPLLAPRPGEEVFDACASPGGKTTDLAALAGGKARITAADVSAGRLRILKETVSRTRSPGIEAVLHDLSRGPLPGADGRFDKVLLDAPCTGTGVIRRNPDAKWRFEPGHPDRTARLQSTMLRNAWRSLKAGGTLVYCTCSVLTEEDEQVVKTFLRAAPDAELPAGPPERWPGPASARTAEGFVRLLPHRHGTDGFFAAAIRKKG